MQLIKIFYEQNQLLVKGVLSAATGGLWCLLVLYIFKLIKKIFSLKNIIKELIEREMPALYWPALSDKKNNFYQQTLLWAGLKKVPSLRALSIGIFVGLIISVILAGSFGVVIFVGCLVLGGGFFLRKAKSNKRLFRRELPDALSSLGDTMRAGFTFMPAVTLLAGELPRPVSELFCSLARSEEIRITPITAINATAKQLNVPEWSLAAKAIVRHLEVGGNILPTLTALATTLRDHEEAAAELKTLTAAGRMSGIVITALMPLTLLLFGLLSPEFITSLFTTVPGQLSFAIAMLLEVIGVIWIYFILKLD